jgi:glycosyltransferase involved in cell wall biosynthesis
MHILALEPYFGGSHRAFLEGWQRHSRHTFTALTLPPRKWKWRMRHAAVTLRDQAAAQLAAGARFDAVFASDMLNVAEWRGLAAPALRDLPAIAYFHENQLTYPYRVFGERDYHFGFTNMTTALAADAVWFNSAFHRDDFLTALTAALKRMPDFQPVAAIDTIRGKSAIMYPGVDPLPPRGPRPSGPLRIIWAARWEHDKNPDDFFAALRILRQQNIDFRISVVGEQFRDVPPIFEQAQREFADIIDRWGYQPTREDYLRALQDADIFVSTAHHEFFGISTAEALAAGCYPLLPRRLAYPELLNLDEDPAAAAFFYDGTPADLAAELAQLAARRTRDTLWPPAAPSATALTQRFLWPRRAADMDDAISALVAP